MDFTEIYTNLYNSLLGTLFSLKTLIFLYAPRVITAIFLLVVGYLVAKYVAKVIRLALDKVELNKLGERIGLAELLVSMGLSPNLSQLLSKLVFASIFLIFIISTADVLNLKTISETIDKFMLYIPNIIGALFIFFLSAITGHFLRQTVLRTGESLRLDFSAPLGNLIYYGILLIGAILAIGQLKIETEFLTRVLEIILITTGAALALSLGFGSREVSKNIISGVYLKDSIEIGALIKVGDIQGKLLEVKPVCFELEDQATGQKFILPNSKLLDSEIVEKKS